MQIVQITRMMWTTQIMINDDYADYYLRGEMRTEVDDELSFGENNSLEIV